MERSLVRFEARELGVIDVVTNDVGYQLPRHPTLLDAPHSRNRQACLDRTSQLRVVPVPR